MTELTIQTPETAQGSAQPILEGALKQLGFVPNLYGTLANSPFALEAYTDLATTAAKRSSFSAEEQQVALIAISIENGCDYCVAAHSTIAASSGVNEASIEAVRGSGAFQDEKLEVLRDTAVALVKKRGWLDAEDVATFVAAGYEPGQLLDLVALSALKTISNYTNHIASTPLDAAFEPRRFETAA